MPDHAGGSSNDSGNLIGIEFEGDNEVVPRQLSRSTPYQNFGTDEPYSERPMMLYRSKIENLFEETKDVPEFPPGRINFIEQKSIASNAAENKLSIVSSIESKEDQYSASIADKARKYLQS